MSSFILLDPDAMMKMDGGSMRRAYIEIGQESLFKGLERFQKIQAGRAKPVDKLPARLSKGLNALFENSPDSEFKSLFLEALKGNDEASRRVASYGLWLAYRQTFPPSTQGGPGLWLDHFVEIEQASVPVDALLRTGEYAAIVDTIKTIPVLAPYFSDTALSRLAVANTAVQALIPRVSGMCEFLLAQVARVDTVYGSHAADQTTQAGFDYLILPSSSKTCAPGREMFHWVKDKLGANTLNALLELAVKGGVSVVDESTLKRWSSGSEFPREDKIQRMVETILANQGSTLEDKAFRQIGLHYWAARRLHKLLELVWRFLMAEEVSINDAGRWSSLLGSASADDWIRARYRFWLGHWQAQQIAVVAPQVD